MKKFWNLFLLLFILAQGLLAEKVIHVAPTGNDLNQGDEAHPLLTLQKAVEQSRRQRAGADEVTIRLAEGVYPIRHAIQLGSQDSGLRIVGDGRGRTRITGGVELPAFQQVRESLWRTDVGSLMALGGDVAQLYVNGERAVCARTPNGLNTFKTGRAEEWKMDSLPDNYRYRMAAQSIQLPDEASAVLRKAQASPSGMRIVVLHAWDMTRRSVQSFSADSAIVFVSGQAMHTWNRMDRPGASLCYLENDRSFLDAPGEYFLDRSEGYLYYIPRENERLEKAVATVPVPSQLLEMKGTAEKWIENVRIENLTLEYSRYSIPWQGNEPNQGACLTDASVSAEYARNLTLQNVEVTHTGNWAVEMGLASRDCRVEHCYLHDLGGGGVKIGTSGIPDDEEHELSCGNHVVNNIICQAGETFPPAVGIMLRNASDNEVVHNDISNLYYTGISVGWVWGYAHCPSVRNTISYNHIHHIGWGILSDMGGIYTLGNSEGTQVSHNRIHDIYSYGYGGWGLYPDEGTTGIVMENNLVYNCKSSGFHQHYGKDNIIRNNIFVNNIKAQLEATRVEPDHLPFTFTGNILQYKEGQMYGINWDKVNFQSDKNIYWRTDGETPSWNGLSLSEWQKKTGKDLHSLVVDPRLADIAKGDFTPKNKKALRKIGFKLFDPMLAGVEGDEEWIRLAQQDPKKAQLYDEIVEKLKKE